MFVTSPDSSTQLLRGTAQKESVLVTGSTRFVSMVVPQNAASVIKTPHMYASPDRDNPLKYGSLVNYKSFLPQSPALVNIERHSVQYDL